MANVDRPSGARFVGTIDGSAPNGVMRTYPVDSSNGTAIFPGDFVVLEADGNVAPVTADTDVILGVCEGVVVDRAVAATEHPGYLPASTAGYIRVNVAPGAIYEVQEDSDGSNLALTDVGSNVDIVAGAGSTTTGNSAHELDSSSVVATTAQLRIIGKVDREDNEIGTNCKWLVTVHESHLKSAGV